MRYLFSALHLLCAQDDKTEHEHEFPYNSSGLSISCCGCRDLVNASYAVIIRAMFAQLERMAGPDVKHGDRLRLENYTLLELELPALANKVH